MSADVHHENRKSISQRNLWFGFFAALVAFSLEGFLGWVISSRACFIGDGRLGPISPAGVRWLLVAMTVVFFAVASYGGVLSYRHWRQLSRERALAHAEAHGAREFIALAGVFVSFSLGVGIVWTSFLFIFLSVCMREH